MLGSGMEEASFPFDSLNDLRDALRDCREIILSNAVMVSEIPAPTFAEEPRLEFVGQRFAEVGFSKPSRDALGNVQALLPGTTGERTILLNCHADTPPLTSTAPSPERITINVGPDSISGQAIADNSLGVSLLASLPDILSRLGIRFRSDLVALASIRSLGDGDLEGLRFFLENFPTPITHGLCIEGVHIGRLSCQCLGMVRAEITTRVPDEVNAATWDRIENAIVIMHRIIHRILKIPIPQEPRTQIILGSVRAGRTYNRPPTTARLKLEIRSETPGHAREVRFRLTEILEEISAETGTENTIRFPSLRKPGGIPFSHPLVRSARTIMKDLGVAPSIGPSYGDLAGLIGQEIPGITIGLTKAENLNEPDEKVFIEPMFTGIAQLLGLLREIDGGRADPEPASSAPR
jgi:acetylornithine deacetylase/succinyl-diaminopimelate desuccinylase-like protein